MDFEQLAENSSALLTAIVAMTTVAEWVGLSLVGKLRSHREGIVNVAGVAIQTLFENAIALAVVLWLMSGLYSYRLFEFGASWYAWGLLWLAYDFIYWFLHLLEHKVRLLWCFHGVHHSAKEMKLSVGFRGSVVGIFSSLHTLIWLPILGFHPLMVLSIDAISDIYGFLVHVSEDVAPDKKRRWYEKFLITPSAHRVHHSKNHLYLDTNYGETFSIWDRLFGTYQDELPSELPVYGVMTEIDSESFAETQGREFLNLWRDLRSADRWLDQARYLIMPPGWNHRGTGVTATQLKRRVASTL